jgi:two-component system OmpR family response regulator
LSFDTLAPRGDTPVRYAGCFIPPMFNAAAIPVNPTPPEGAAVALTHVLVVDDDPSVRQMVVDYLGDNDIQVTAVASGREIADVTAREMIDLLILDLKLPGEDGMEIARRIRVDSNMPIIMLTGRKEEADRVMALELGADDYLTKPFSPRELLARIRALLRRSRAHETVADGLARIRAYRFAGWELNVRVRRLKSPSGDLMTLRNAEFNLLAAFLASPQRVLTREQLLSMSHLHNDEVYDRAIDTQVGRLRKKLEEHGAAGQDLIRTERGVGYLLTVPVDVVR